MGEDQPQTGRRLTIDQAADYLGISPDAVRSRVKRGTLASEREAGRVYVLVDADRPRPAYDRPTTGQSADNALTSQMQSEIDHLRGQLEAERQANAEARRLLAAALERIQPALEAPQEGSSAAPAESSTRGVARDVSIGVIIWGITALLGKILVPLVFSVVAFVFAGVAALNGQFLAALVSGGAGVLSGLLSYLLGRRQVEREQSRVQEAWDDIMRQTLLQHDELKGRPPPNGHSGGAGGGGWDRP